GFGAVHLQGLDSVIEGTQGDIADGARIAADLSHNRFGLVGYHGLFGGLVLAVLFHTGQFHKGAAGAGTVFTSDYGDGVISIVATVAAAAVAAVGFVLS